MSFNNLANELAEPNTLSSTHWFFHGCLAASIESIIQKGLEIKEAEPCLTPNPASALWKYANPASNSRNIYSGKAWHEINHLIEENKIAPGKTEAETWQVARRYWRSDASSGGAFVFFIDPSAYQVLPVGKVLLEAQEVHGSISKWIYGHCTVTQRENQGSITLPGNTMVGYLKPGKSWSNLFVQLHPGFSGFILPLEKIAEQVQILLNTSSAYHPLQKEHSNEQIAWALVDNAANAFLLQEVRKLLVAIAFIHGHEIVKDDHTPPEKWPVSAPGQTMDRLAAFMEVEYANPQLQDRKEYWLTRLKTYLREPENEN